MAAAVDAEIHRHSVEPRVQRGVIGEIETVAMQAEKCFLRDILGIGPVAEDAECDAQKLGFAPADDLVEIVVRGPGDFKDERGSLHASRLSNDWGLKTLIRIAGKFAASAIMYQRQPH